MKTIECQLVVDENHRAVLDLPDDVIPGRHRARVTIEEERRSFRGDPLAGMPVISVSSWPEELSLRREDLYGDDGR